MSSPEQSRYEDLLQRHLPALRRLCWSYARDEAETDDLLQEIALALWTALPRFRGDSTERTWLYRVGHNTAISYLTGTKRRAAREHGCGCSSVAEVPSATDPESDAIQRQRQMHLQQAIRELPVTDRQVIVLYLEGLTARRSKPLRG